MAHSWTLIATIENQKQVERRRCVRGEEERGREGEGEGEREGEGVGDGIKRGVGVGDGERIKRVWEME